MTRCDDAIRSIDARVDGELGAWRAFALRRHLVSCVACARRDAALRAERARVAAALPAYRAPAELVAELRARYAPRRGPATRPASTGGRRWRWLGAGAMGGALVGIAATLATGVAVRVAAERQAAHDEAIEAVVAHVRAVAAHGLVQVASSDHHTVKPWLSARLDYSPPVEDLAERGFALVGARLDTLDGRPTATLVYRYREHTVDVFVRPVERAGDGSADTAPGATSVRNVRGFHVVDAAGDGMRWVVVSDVNAAALGDFAAALARL